MPKTPTADILIYYGKHGDQYWLVDTPRRLEAAQRALFHQLDEYGSYEDTDFGCPADALTAARKGDIRSIRSILERRNGCEYEEWAIEAAEIAE